VVVRMLHSLKVVVKNTATLVVKMEPVDKGREVSSMVVGVEEGCSSTWAKATEVEVG